MDRTLPYVIRHLQPGETVPKELFEGAEQMALNPDWTVVAEASDGTLAGLVILYGCGHAACLMDALVVHPEHRGRNLFAALLSATIDLVRDRGYTYLWGYSGNPRFWRRARLSGAIVGPQESRIVAWNVTAGHPKYFSRGQTDG